MQEQIGRYEIRRELGRGGMATVFLAFDPRFRRQVAVKVLPRQFTHDPRYLERFEREAHTVATLEHPAIVPVHDFGDHDDAPYLVMRFMSGGTLEDRMTGEPLNLELIVGVLERLAPALDKAHEMGIIHRDLKPANILFDDDGYPYLADFGIATLAEATQTMTVIGTPAYMSPEQVEGDVEVDGRVDVYALGVMLYELFSGSQPYSASTPTKLMMAHVLQPLPDILEANPDLPTGAQAVIEKAMAKDRDERYMTASEVLVDLKKLQNPELAEAARAAAAAAVIAPDIVQDSAVEAESESDDQPAAEVVAVTAAVTSAEAPAGGALPAAATVAAVGTAAEQDGGGGPTAPPADSADKKGGVPIWVWGVGALALLAIVILGVRALMGGGGEDSGQETAVAVVSETTMEDEGAAVAAVPTKRPTATVEPSSTVEVAAPLVEPTETATLKPTATVAATKVLAAEEVETATSSPTPTASVTPELELQTPQFVVGFESVNVREGPGSVFDIAAILFDGDRVDVIGRNSNGTWLLVSLLDGKTGWISSVVGTLENESDENPILLAATIPPWPTSTNTPFPTATATRIANGTTTATPISVSPTDVAQEYP